jgi:purine-cytosine permease-like protein
MGFGALFLLAFAGGLAGLYSLRQEWVTVAGIKERLSRLVLGMWAMAAVAWATVITGTYIVYPWYRAKPPEGTADLSAFPRSELLADPAKAAWHTFGMEWKEHVGWIAPIAATVAAYVVMVYGPRLAQEPRIRRAVTWFFVGAFATAAVAGIFGAFINKVAPVR